MSNANKIKSNSENYEKGDILGNKYTFILLRIANIGLKWLVTTLNYVALKSFYDLRWSVILQTTVIVYSYSLYVVYNFTVFWIFKSLLLLMILMKVLFIKKMVVK